MLLEVYHCAKMSISVLQRVMNVNNVLLCLYSARNEAREISVFLKPIERLVEDLENVEFNEVKGRIAPLMHTMCLIWANSKYYNTPARVIVLLQEICNLLIRQVWIVVME